MRFDPLVTGLVAVLGVSMVLKSTTSTPAECPNGKCPTTMTRSFEQLDAVDPSVQSRYGYRETIAKLKAAAEKSGLTVAFDRGDEALDKGLDSATQVLIVYSPKEPELPFRISIRETGGFVRVVAPNASVIAEMYKGARRTELVAEVGEKLGTVLRSVSAE